MPTIIYTANYLSNINQFNNDKTNSTNQNNQNSPFDLKSFKEKCIDFKVDILQNDFQSMLIAPTYKQAVNIEKDIIKTYFKINGKASPKLNIFNYNKFTNLLYDLLVPSNKYKSISDNFQLALIEQALNKIQAKEKNEGDLLKYYKKDFKLNNKNLLSQFKNIINGLRNKGIDSNSLLEKYKELIENTNVQSNVVDKNVNNKKKNVFIAKSNSDDKIGNLIYNQDKLFDFIIILQEYENLLGETLLDSQKKVDIIIDSLINFTPIFEKFSELSAIQCNDNIVKFEENILEIYKFIKESQNNNVNELKFSKLIELYKLYNYSILFNGFSEFEHNEINLLHTLKNLGFKLCINFDITEISSQLFGNLNKNIREIIEYQSSKFKEEKFKDGRFNDKKFNYELFNDKGLSKDLKFQKKVYESHQNLNLENSTILKPSVYLKELLFDFDNNKSSPIFDKITSIYSAKNSFDEVEEICRLCQYYLENPKFEIEPMDIVISCRNPQSYADKFREIGLKNNVLFNISDRFELVYSKVVAEIINFLEIFKEGFDINNFINLNKYHYLSFNYNSRDKSQFELFNLKNLKKNKYILYSNRNNLILSILDNLKELKFIKDKNRVTFTNFVEGKSNEVIKEIKNLNKSIVEFYDVYSNINFFTEFEDIENTFSKNEIDEDLYNLINQDEYKFSGDDKFYLKIPTPTEFYNVELNYDKFKDMIINILSKHKVLLNITKFREDIFKDLNSQNNKVIIQDDDNKTESDFGIIDFNLNSILMNNLEDNFSVKSTTQNNIKTNIKSNIYENLENDAKAYIKFLEVLNELGNINNDINPNAAKNFGEWLDNLKSIIENTKYQINERINKSVTVTSIEQTRGINYKINILCGLTESEFPKIYLKDNLMGITLKDKEAKHYNSEKMLLFHYFNNNIEVLDEFTEQNKDYWKPNSDLDINKDKIVKLNYIFIPKSTNNKENKDSSFLEVILKLINNSRINKKTYNELNNEIIKLKELESEIYKFDNNTSYQITGNQQINQVRQNYVFDLPINKWTKYQSLITNKYKKNYISKFENKKDKIEYLNIDKIYNKTNYEKKLKSIKEYYLANNTLKISDLNHIFDVNIFTKNQILIKNFENIEEINVINKEIAHKIFKKFTNLFDEKNKFEYLLVKSDIGTYLHSAIESTIHYYRIKKVNNSNNLNQHSNLLTNENINEFFLDENDFQSVGQNEDVKSNLNEFLQSKVNQVLANNTYQKYIKYKLNSSLENIITFCNKDIKLYNILFTELNFETTEYITQNNIKINVKGNTDLVCLDRSNNEKNEGDEILSLSIFDIKTGKIYEGLQLFLYKYCLNKLLETNKIDLRVKSTGVFDLSITEPKIGKEFYIKFSDDKSDKKDIIIYDEKSKLILDKYINEFVNSRLINAS